MTNEEARAILEEVKTIDDSMYQYNPAYLEALEMAIAALEAEPCEDAVKREAVLNTLDAMDKALDENRTVEAYKELLKECYKELLPVIPKPRTGKWIDDKCSVCGKGIEDLISSPEWYRNEEPNFCPNCGAKMEGE